MQHPMEFRRCMRNHPRFLVHFGISYQRTLVLCLINLLHVGNVVFLWVRGLSHCHLLHLLAIKMGGGLECFYCCSEIVLCQLSMHLPFLHIYLRPKTIAANCDYWHDGHYGQSQKAALYQSVTFNIQILV